jgi:hypothetical protein
MNVAGLSDSRKIDPNTDLYVTIESAEGKHTLGNQRDGSEARFPLLKSAGTDPFQHIHITVSTDEASTDEVAEVDLQVVNGFLDSHIDVPIWVIQAPLDDSFTPKLRFKRKNLKDTMRSYMLSKDLYSRAQGTDDIDLKIAAAYWWFASSFELASSYPAWFSVDSEAIDTMAYWLNKYRDKSDSALTNSWENVNRLDAAQVDSEILAARNLLWNVYQYVDFLLNANKFPEASSLNKLFQHIWDISDDRSRDFVVKNFQTTDGMPGTIAKHQVIIDDMIASGNRA